MTPPGTRPGPRVLKDAARFCNRYWNDGSASMSELIERRLLELGVELPPPAPTVANYLASVRIGQLIFLAGQLPFKDGRLMAMGILGRELGTEAGKLAA